MWGIWGSYSNIPKAIYLRGDCKDKKDWARDFPQHAPSSQPRHEEEKNLKYDRVYPGANVVPFWVCVDFWVRDYNILPKKELHRRVWVY